MSLLLFASGSLAKEETRYIKGLVAVLREQSSIQRKTLTKPSVVLKCLPWRQKGIWHKVEAEENQGRILCGKITNFPFKIKKSFLGQKIRVSAYSPITPTSLKQIP